MKKLLIIRSRELCYFSAEFFLNRIEAALSDLGEEVLRLDLDYENPDFSILEQFKEGDLSGILDINSKLPGLIDDNGAFWLDSLKAPFFNYILDHPLYHHPGLRYPLRDYHVLGIDKYHCSYMKEAYPHLKSVNLVPVSGTGAVNPVPFKERPIDFLFSGTYISKKQLSNELKDLENRFGKEYISVLELLLDKWNPFFETLESCALRILDRTIDPDYLNMLYPVDRIKRNTLREQYLLEASQVSAITILGEGWEHSKLFEKNNVSLIQPMAYANSIEVMGKSKTIIDINPAFKCGIHDRVSNGFANSCLVISNMSKDFDKNLKDENNLLYYQESIGDIVENISGMSDKDKEIIAKAGNDYYKDNLTWENFGKRFLAIKKETV